MPTEKMEVQVLLKRWYLEKHVRVCTGSTGTGQGLMAGSCKHITELFGYNEKQRIYRPGV
jgi:hypothetical protein